MATIAELLKQAGIKEEVIAGLPAEVVTAVEGHVAAAATQFSQAEELRRQAELERQEINSYVENYGQQLTQSASVQAENRALKTYLESLKAQGFEIQMPTVTTASNGQPVVPGSPAMGANAPGFDPNKFQQQVGTAMSQWFDANNEHMRLFGAPIPESSESLFAEAARARKSPLEFIAERYKFADKRTEQEKAAFQKRVDDEVKQKLEKERQASAERNGSNPNLRPGEPSRNSFVPKIRGEEFHKSDGNVPRRERMGRMLDNIHKDVQAAQQGVA